MRHLSSPEKMLINLLALRPFTLKNKKTKDAMVVSEVRRSDWLKAISRGFKGKLCEKANSFCCSIKPPSLSKKVIKSLGTYFARLSLVLFQRKPYKTNQRRQSGKPAGLQQSKKCER
jgi:hypothetical protein